MLESPNIPTDPFTELLAEALRAGPGSPAWHDAVSQLRSRGASPETDELKLLLAARQHLESGKGYRAIRAGPGFTRKLFDAIEEDASPGARRIPTVATVAAVCAILVIVGISVVAILFRGNDATIDDANLQKLAKTYFAQSVVNESFEETLDTFWQPIGSLTIESRRGLRVATTSPASSAGGGVVWSQWLPSTPICVEATLRVQKQDDDVAAQVFVTDQPEFSADRGTTPHELVCVYQGGQIKLVLPGGRVETQFALPKDFKGQLVLRLTLDEKNVIVDLDAEKQPKKRLFTGPHQLDGQKWRQLGLRFLRRGDVKIEGIQFSGLRVSKP